MLVDIDAASKCYCFCFSLVLQACITTSLIAVWFQYSLSLHIEYLGMSDIWVVYDVSQCHIFLFGILISQVRTLDDGCVFFLASLPKDTFTVAEKVFELYSTGEIKGQAAKRGTLGKKLDLKGSNFKHARGVDAMILHELLCEVASQEKTISEMTAECVKVKRLRDLQHTFVVQTGSESWEEAKQKYPTHTTPEALDELLCVSFNPKTPTPR